MKESFRKPEYVISEQKVLSAFEKEENQEAKDLLIKYVDQCHAEADIEANKNPDQSNLINIKTEVNIAELYLKIPDSKYKQYAIESLEEIYRSAGSNNIPDDLINKITLLINR